MFSHFLRKLTPFGTTALPRLVPHMDAAGWHWQLDAGTAEVLGPDGPELARWTADGLVQLVKENPARSVYRIRLPGGAVFLKRCRAWNLRAWAREVLRPAKARLEFENALQLAAVGLAAVVPLGWACRRPGWPGESLLLTREVEGAVPFLKLLEEDLSSQPGLRQHVAEELGRFLARMHDAGVAHPDPHPGNFLVNLDASGQVHFTLIDVHAVRLRPPLPWNESRANLVLFNRWFQLRANRADRLRFWEAYVNERQTAFPHSETKRQITEVETRTLASNLRFWSRRESRCLGSGRHFRKVRKGSIQGIAVQDLHTEVVQSLLADPDAIFTKPGVTLLKDSRTSTVAEWPVDGRVLIFKRFRLRAKWEFLKNVVRPSAALRSWMNGHSLRDRWLPTPRPLAILHRVKSSLRREGYLLTEKVADALTLPEAVSRLLPLPPRERTRIARLWSFRIARLIRTLHLHGGSHRDLKASNILLESASLDLEAALPVFIDLVGARTGRPIGNSRRARELARLNASFMKSPLVSRTDRLRFLKTYLLANLGKAGNWKWWWKAITRATAAKQARNLRTGRPLA